MIKKITIVLATNLALYAVFAFIGVLTSWDSAMLDPGEWHPLFRGWLALFMVGSILCPVIRGWEARSHD